MKIIQTVGIVKDSEIKVTLPEPLDNGEVDVIITNDLIKQYIN